MLTKDDVAWIKANRSEILRNRTVIIELLRYVDVGVDPITGEPIRHIFGESGEGLTPNLTGALEWYGSADVIWKEFIANSPELEMIGGVVLENGDVRVTFPPDFEFDGLAYVRYDDTLYTIVAKDRRGIGAVNRIEAIARRVN